MASERELRLKLNLVNPEILSKLDFSGTRNISFNLKFANPEALDELKKISSQT